MAKMDERALKAIVGPEIVRAIGHLGSGGTIAKAREQALDYYYGRPFGNEIEGRSQVVSTDVSDVIESIMPSLMKIFAATDDVAKFEPRGQEDEQAAQQATEYVNFLFYSDNPGFLILHDWFKDALLQKLGAVKAWWAVETKVTEQTLTGLTDDELAILLDDEGVEPIEHTEYPDPSAQAAPAPDPMAAQMPAEGQMGHPGMEPAPPPAPMAQPGMMPPPAAAQTLHDVKIRRTAKEGRVRAEGIPPEETLISPGSRSRADAKLLGHRVRTTRSKLKEEGYDPKLVDQIPFGDTSQITGTNSRTQDEDDLGSANMAGDQATEIVYVNEIYIQVDFDGDGKAELRKITCAGPSEADIILENEPADENPIYLLCPVRVPHKVIGQSVADLVMDLQLIKSTLQRQLLDNVYLINNPRNVVIEGQVNLDDLLTNRPGGLVRAKSANAVTPLAVQPMLAPALQSIEYFDSVRETRTGVTRYNQGLDANSLNKTASGVNAIMNAAQMRVELIARIFAETGVKDLFRGILRLVVKHQDKERVIRLRNEWVPVDPRSWNADMDMSVAVGLGTGNKDQMLQHMVTLLGVQKEAAQAPATLVTPQNFYNAFGELVAALGLKGVEKYFTDPSKAPPQQPKPSPDEIKAQTMQQQAQMDMKAKEMDLQMKEREHGMKMEQMDRERERDILDHQITMTELQARMQAAMVAPAPMQQQGMPA